MIKLFVFVIVAIESLYAANTGSITGYVTDPSSAIVPGATLILKASETGITSKAKADDHGFYQFLQLAPGKYELTAEASGFRKETIVGINVLLDQIVTYNVKLEVGQVTETVEVTGGVNALVEPEKVATSANISPVMVQSFQSPTGLSTASGSSRPVPPRPLGAASPAAPPSPPPDRVPAP